MSNFKEKVLEVVKNIKKGEFLTYKQVAQQAGSPGAFRAVGTIMSRNKDIEIPCHRVIMSNGELGSYNNLRGKTKKELLEEEGAL